jgi:nucleoid DNA-binding protein
MSLGFEEKSPFQVTECLFGQIKVSLECGDDVLDSGFGKFCVKKK